MQEAFCQAYVANGGKAADAARAAGYQCPHVVGSQALAKPHVSARVRELMAGDLNSKLGQAMHKAFEIALDADARPADRLKAVARLMDRGGLGRVVMDPCF